MAKRKTPKKEKMVDLSPKQEKVTEQELARVQSTVRTMDQLTTELGRMELHKQGLLKSVEKVQTELDDMRQGFIKEYGTDNVNIQTGEISYPPENPNTEDNGEADKKD